MNKYRLIAFVLIAILIVTSFACTCTIVDNKIEYDCYGDLIPCDNGTYDLGDILTYWHNLFITDIIIDGAITSSNDLNVYCTNNSTLILTYPVYKDIVVNMTTAKPPTSLPPTWRPYLQSQVPAFDQNNINVMYFSAEIPSDYVDGTDLEFHIHIVYPDNNAGNSVWYFSWVWENIDDTYPAVANSTTVVVASPTTADYHQEAEIKDIIDGTGKESQSVLLCSIQRLGNHGSDTYPNEIYLISADFNYRADKIGSVTPTH